MRIAVFCAANNNIAQVYFDEARRLGQWMAQHGHSLVFGGTNSGLMNAVAEAMHDGGGRTIGVIPQILPASRRYKDLDVEIPCDNLSDRKDLMLAHSDAIVALPGGIGTLDEIFTVASANTIGYHKKRVIVYNIGGYWNPLVRLLDHLQDNGMIRGNYSDQILIANSFEDVTRLIEEDGAE